MKPLTTLQRQFAEAYTRPSQKPVIPDVLRIPPDFGDPRSDRERVYYERARETYRRRRRLLAWQAHVKAAAKAVLPANVVRIGGGQ